MATAVVRRDLPQQVGRLSWGWWIFYASASALVGFAAFAWSRQLDEGLVVTGLRDLGSGHGAPWGLYVAFDVYFVGVSFAGITVAALIRLFNLARLRPLARMAELLTVVSLLLAAFAIMADLGQPGRAIVNLFRYGRPQSPFFGTFTLVISGYLFASLVYLYLTSRRDAARLRRIPSRLQWLYRLWAAGYEDTPEQRARDQRATFWLALVILPLLVVAHSSLGFVFGLQVGRPGWFGTLQAPAFVVLAGVSGIGHLIMLAIIMRRVLHLEGRITLDALAWLGRFMMVLLFAYLYFVTVEVLTTTYQATEPEHRLSEGLLFGRYAWVFWGSVGLLLISAVALTAMALRRRWSPRALFAAGAAVNLGAIGKRLLIVVPSETHGQLLPYGIGHYSPSWVEIGIILGLMGLGALLIGVFAKIFPIVELEEERA
jgi:molybdopterin-containing oxidoreductase family membrane subunit